MTDYGSGVGGQVDGPVDAPSAVVQQALEYICPGCMCNVAIERGNHAVPTVVDGWCMVIAHDDDCPVLLEHERSTIPQGE